MDYLLRQRSKRSRIDDETNSTLLKDVKRFKTLPYLTGKHWLLIFLFYCGIVCIVFYCEHRFPTPLSVSDAEKIKTPRSEFFSEERARNFVSELSSIGPKPTGSYENEILAVDYLLRQLNHIKSLCKTFNTIEIDVQTTTGCFPLRFKDGMTSCYENVKNIVAKIGPQQSNSSLLVNCHFDSVPTSPGASDDIVSCAIMLESLLSLSQHTSPLPHSVIFLFNGAEENILQASHGFITQHKWAKEVVAFINLEACGAGGKQMMFQADKAHSWLIEAYANGAKYPHGSVVAQEIFESGIIPSDTDYRIFKHFGGLPGLDFAFVKNGYVYHTKYDSLQFINPGSIQHAGENILNLIHESLKSTAMQNPGGEQNKQLVFFDVLGIFMIVYSTKIATVINIVIISLSMIDMWFKSSVSSVSIVPKLKLVGRAILIFLTSLVGILVANASMALFLGFFNSTMSWYRTPALIVGLYGTVSATIILLIHSCVKTKHVTNPRESWLHEDVYFDASRLLWIGLLVILQLAGVNSSFICTIWILFPTLVRGFAEHVLGIVGYKGTLKSHLMVHLIMQIIPLIVLTYCVWSLYSVFIPITGRIGAMISPEIPIALLTAVLVFLITTYMVSLVQVSTSLRKVVAVISSIALVSSLLVCLTSVGFPYSEDPNSPAPMRVYVLHTDRAFYNKSGFSISKDSGYWVIPLDYNGRHVLSPYINGLKEAEAIDCHGVLGCGMPFVMPVVSLLRGSYYIPASKPKIHGHRKFQIISREVIGEYLHRLSFRAIGPDHMTFFLSPHPDIQLVEWSLYIGTPLPGLEFKGRQTYFVYYSYGEYTNPWEFSIVLKVPKNHTKTAPMIDISFFTHRLHGTDAVTGDFPVLLDNLPQYAHATPWTCSLDMYVF